MHTTNYLAYFKKNNAIIHNIDDYTYFTAEENLFNSVQLAMTLYYSIASEMPE